MSWQNDPVVGDASPVPDASLVVQPTPRPTPESPETFPPGIHPPYAWGDQPPTADRPRRGSRGSPSIGTRAEWAGTGGLYGAYVGSAGGPLGTIAGGGLGAAGGSAVFDSITSLKAMLEDRPQDVVPPEAQFREMASEGMADVGFSMGGALFQPIRFGRALLGKVSGVTTEASKALQETAERLGIGLGAIDVGGGAPKGFARSIGVFPWISGPLKKGQVQKLTDADRAINRTLDAFGPNGTLASEIGVDMVAAARDTHTQFRRTASALYKGFEDAVASASRQDIIPTETIRQFGAELSSMAQMGGIMLSNQKPLPPAAQEGVVDYLMSLQQLPDLITPQQYRRLTADLSDLIGKNIKDGFDVHQLTQAKKALEVDFANIRTDLLPPGEGEGIRSALQTANSFYAKGIVQFQTRAASVLERVDRLIFHSGAQRTGSLNADELYRVALNLKSPQQVKDLTQLVGKKSMRAAASHNFENAVTAARSDVEVMGQTFSVVDPVALERSLGLVGAGRQRIEGLRELYKTAGVDLDDVRALIDVMKKIEGVGNASEFVRRRAVLGGARGALAALGGVGGATLASGVPGGAITAVGMTFAARHLAKVFARPDRLKSMVTALDEAADASLRRAALAKVIRSVLEEADPDLPVDASVLTGE